MPLYKGHDAIIKKNNATIGYVADVEVTIDRSPESYFQIQDRIANQFIDGPFKITGKLTKAWIDVDFLLFLEGDSELESFDLEVLLPTMKVILYNCKVSKGTFSIPQDGILKEDYEFIALSYTLLEWPLGEIINFEPLDWAYFKNKGEIWFNQESGAYIGYPIYLTDPYCIQGGGYFDR